MIFSAVLHLVGTQWLWKQLRTGLSMGFGQDDLERPFQLQPFCDSNSLSLSLLVNSNGNRKNIRLSNTGVFANGDAIFHQSKETRRLCCGHKLPALWWVHQGQQPSIHTAVGPDGLQERTGRMKARELVGQDKYHLLGGRRRGQG